MANGQGLLPIHYAAEKIHPDAVLYLHSRAPKLFDVNQRSIKARRTALHYAVRFWHPEQSKRKCQKKLVQVLAAFKADHSLPDAVGHVPLFNAILSTDKCLVDQLIEYAPIDHEDDDGDTHLHIAAELSLVEIARLLIEKGANPMAQNHKDQTPFHIAAQRCGTLLEEMAHKAKDVDLAEIFMQEDTSKLTPLDYAAQYSQKKAFQCMWTYIEQGHKFTDTTNSRHVLNRLFVRKGNAVSFITLRQSLEQHCKPV